MNFSVFKQKNQDFYSTTELTTSLSTSRTMSSESLEQNRDDVYLINKDLKTNLVEKYAKSNPTPLDNLLSLYGLEPITKSVARVNPDGSKGVKVRKSYKNHIQDLPGKHQIPNSKPIPMAILDPNLGQTPSIIKQLDPKLLDQALKFEKTSLNGIPGFNTADLAINDQQVLMRGDDMSETDEYGNKKNKRKKKVQANGNGIKRQHI